MVKKFVIISLALALIGFFVFSPNLTLADDNTDDVNQAIKDKTALGSITVPGLFGNVGAGVLGFIGVIIVILIIYGGFIWMTAAGNEEKIKKGRNIVFGALIGMAVVFASYGIGKLVYDTLGAQDSSNNGGTGGDSDCSGLWGCYPSQDDCQKVHNVDYCKCFSNSVTCGSSVCCVPVK